MQTFKANPVEVHRLMKVLLDNGNNLESISVMVDKSFSTVYEWFRGKRIPKKGDYELLKRMAEKIIKEED